jgi:short-subunit dehydrogenase
LNPYWQEKVVLITGASSGIGSALAVSLARRGAHLALLARRVDLLDNLAAEIKRNGGKALAITCDVRDLEAVQRAAEATRGEFGCIDVAVANAGMGIEAAAWKILPSDVAETFAVNVIGAANMIAAVLPVMLEQGSGHLVAISSLASYRGLPRAAAYSASKAAMSNYFESLRIDLRGKGIDVTTVNPGFIRTAMTGGEEAKAPFLMELDAATQKLVQALERRPSVYAFPWQLATIVRLMKFMPNSLYDPIVSRFLSRA